MIPIPYARRHDVSLGQPRVGERVVGIGGDGLLKQIDTLREAFVGPPIPELAAFEVETIRLRVGCAGATHVLLFGDGRVPAKAAGKIARDVALHLGDVGHLARVALPPHL